MMRGRGYVYGILLIAMAAICFVGFQPAIQAKIPGKSGHSSGRMNKTDKEVSSPSGRPVTDEEITEGEKELVLESYYKLPLYFQENRGQLDSRVSYYSKLPGHSVYFTKDKIVFELTRRRGPKEKEKKEKGREGFKGQNQGPIERQVFTLRLENSRVDPFITGEDKQKGKVNYFIGSEPEKWRTNIPTYKTVAYQEVYPGIDMKFYGNHRQLEYDVIVKPGANPSTPLFSFEGIEGLRVTDEGDLEIALKEGNLIQKKPYIFQEIEGERIEIEGKFKILNSTGWHGQTRLSVLNGTNLQPEIGNPQDEILRFAQNDKKRRAQNDNKKANLQFSYGFEVASYNKNHALIIDPVLAYSTYLGGSDIDKGFDIAVDTSGNAYVTGWASSTDFPTASPIYGTNSEDYDVFVAKIDGSGSSLVYSTYLGGSGSDESYSIAVDTSGNAYVTGTTVSTDFPTASPIYGAISGYSDAFVTKIDASGSTLAYSTYLGGGDYDTGVGIAVDTSGNAYVTGRTESTDFPTASPLYGAISGYDDAFVTKIDASGSSLVYSTYLGGSDSDRGYGIAVDTSGNAYVTGWTYSTDFPTASPIYGTYAGGWDVFVTKINASGSTLAYSTYLGGSGDDLVGLGIAVDTSGNAYVTGQTSSTDFPTASPIYGANAGWHDVFVTKIDASGSSLVYSTYLGGSGDDESYGIAVDTSGNAYVTGYTNSANFPTASPIYGTLSGGTDAFVTKINASGSSLVYSTYLGGSGSDYGYGIAVDTSGNAYVTGQTSSTDFPTASPIQGTFAGYFDAFITKIVDGNPAPDISVSPTSHDFEEVDVGSASLPQTFTVSNTGDADLIIDTISLTGTDITDFAIQYDGCSGLTFAPLGTCSVDLVFSPISEGSKSSNLSIPSNDPDTPTLDVSLSGTGEVAVTCDYSISPTSQTFDSVGGTGSVSISTDDVCDWTATSNDTWITIDSGNSGTGDGTVNYSVSENTNTSSRTGTITIAGENFTVTQEGSNDGGLSAPANFSASVEDCTTSIFGTSCTVSLNWTGVSAATGYKLYYGYSSGSYAAPVDLGNVTSVTFSGVPGGTYYLALSAYDSSGNESNKSEELEIFVGESSVPTNFNAIVSDCKEDAFGSTTSCAVSLSWTGVSGSSGYYLHYGFSSSDYAGSIDVGSVTSVSYAGIASGIYYLALTSYDGEGVESGYSDELILEVGSNSVNRVERNPSPFTR